MKFKSSTLSIFCVCFLFCWIFMSTLKTILEICLYGSFPYSTKYLEYAVISAVLSALGSLMFRNHIFIAAENGLLELRAFTFGKKQLPFKDIHYLKASMIFGVLFLNVKGSFGMSYCILPAGIKGGVAKSFFESLELGKEL